MVRGCVFFSISIFRVSSTSFLHKYCYLFWHANTNFTFIHSHHGDIMNSCNMEGIFCLKYGGTTKYETFFFIKPQNFPQTTTTLFKLWRRIKYMNILRIYIVYESLVLIIVVEENVELECPLEINKLFASC